MIKIYRRTIQIGTPDHLQQRIEYRVEEKPGFRFANILAIPAMVAGAILGTLMFSMFFIILLIPLGIFGFRAWRLMKSAQQQPPHRDQDESISAEYTVVTDKDKP